jgi:hypothetical protein
MDIQEMSIQDGFGTIQGGPWIAWTVRLDQMDRNRIPQMEHFEGRKSCGTSSLVSPCDISGLTDRFCPSDSSQTEFYVSGLLDGGMSVRITVAPPRELPLACTLSSQRQAGLNTCDISINNLGGLNTFLRRYT